jgi:hypothetical protein
VQELEWLCLGFAQVLCDGLFHRISRRGYCRLLVTHARILGSASDAVNGREGFSVNTNSCCQVALDVYS